MFSFSFRIIPLSCRSPSDINFIGKLPAVVGEFNCKSYYSRKVNQSADKLPQSWGVCAQNLPPNLSWLKSVSIKLSTGGFYTQFQEIEGEVDPPKFPQLSQSEQTSTLLHLFVGRKIFIGASRWKNLNTRIDGIKG